LLDNSKLVTVALNIFVQVLDRGEKIELLVDKTENLRSQVCYSLSLRNRLLSSSHALALPFWFCKAFLCSLYSFSRLVYAYLHLQSGADEISGV